MDVLLAHTTAAAPVELVAAGAALPPDPPVLPILPKLSDSRRKRRNAVLWSAVRVLSTLFSTIALVLRNGFRGAVHRLSLLQGVLLALRLAASAA